MLTGFARNAVLGVAGEVVKAVKGGQLRHIFLIGGCDGSEPDRRYFGKAADATPEDTMVLTLGCGKFRFYDHPNLQGNIPGTPLPRLVDMGQCNDAYSAIVVADALAKAFDTDLNGLPLSLDLSWLEQKAVVVLLSLLHLGLRNIRWAGVVVWGWYCAGIAWPDEPPETRPHESCQPLAAVGWRLGGSCSLTSL